MKWDSGAIGPRVNHCILRSTSYLAKAASQLLGVAAFVLSVNACASDNSTVATFSVVSSAGESLTARPLGEFDKPWAMTFLPDGELLVTEKGGRLWLLGRGAGLTSEPTGHEASGRALGDNLPLSRQEVTGLPQIMASGQGGLGDIVLHPDFADNQQRQAKKCTWR